jgi:hypothetical protein
MVSVTHKRDLLSIVNSATDISDGHALVFLLNQSQYIAIGNTGKFPLVDKCNCESYRSGGFGLTEFGYTKTLMMISVSTQDNRQYLLVGPGDMYGFTTPQEQLESRLAELL